GPRWITWPVPVRNSGWRLKRPSLPWTEMRRTMADRTIGALPVANYLDDDSLLVVEQQSQARSIKGALFRQFAVESVDAHVKTAQSAAEQAKQSAQNAASSASSAMYSASTAQTAKQEAIAARMAIENMGVEGNTL